MPFEVLVLAFWSEENKPLENTENIPLDSPSFQTYTWVSESYIEDREEVHG